MKRILPIILLITVLFNTSKCNELYSKTTTITDTSLVNFILKQNYTKRDSLQRNDYGTFAISFKNDSSNTLILLHNGTEIKRLDSTSSDKVLKSYPYLKSKKEFFYQNSVDSISDKKYSDAEFIDNRPLEEKLLSLGLWENKIELNEKFYVVNAGTNYNVLMTELEIANHHKKIYYGAGLSITSFHGTLNDTISSKYPDYGGTFGFKLSIGIPFIKYTLRNAGERIPTYAWLSNNIYELFLNEKASSFFNIYDNGLKSSHSWNMEHQFNIKVWNFHYDILVDGDVYTSAIHQISFQDLNTFFGTWDLKVIKSPTVWIPGFRFTTKEIHIKDYKYKTIKLPLSTSIIYTDVFYKNTSQFNIGAGIKFKLGIEDGEK